MRWHLTALIFLLSFSVHSQAGLTLPKHEAVTYTAITVHSVEPSNAGDRWIVISVQLNGVKVLGEKYLNGLVSFSYDSHYQGDRADLGLKFSEAGSGSLSKPVSRGGFKQYKHGKKISQYVGSAKWQGATRVAQYIYGVKKNGEQDYVMFHWMLANAQDIIDYAVANNGKMSSRAKNGWRKVGNFSKAAYGDTKISNRILSEADDKTKQLAAQKQPAEQVNKIRSLTYEVNQLNDLVVSLREKNRKLSSELAVHKKSTDSDSKYCYRYNRNDFTKALNNGKCFGDRFEISSTEYQAKKLGKLNAEIALKFATIEKSRSKLRTYLHEANMEKGESQSKIDQLRDNVNELNIERRQLQAEVKKLQNTINIKTTELTATRLQLSASLYSQTSNTDQQTKRVKELEHQVVTLKDDIRKASNSSKGNVELKKRNAKLLLTVIELKEQADELTDRVDRVSVLNSNLEAIGINYCVSTKIKHAYAIAENDKCLKPYVPINAIDLAEFASTAGIKEIATTPWIAVSTWEKSDVSAVQSLLVAKGLSSSKPDGLLGPNTVKGLQRLINQNNVRLVSGKLYVTRKTNDLLLAEAHVNELQRKLTNSQKANTSEIEMSSAKDVTIKKLNADLAKIKSETNKNASAAEKTFKLQIQQLNDLVRDLQKEIAKSKKVESSSQATMIGKDQEIKRLTRELQIAQEKLKKINPTESSFMDTLSDEWRQLVSDMPLTERLFCDLYHNFEIKKARAQASNNQIQVNMVHRSFQEDLDSLMPGGALDQWIVKILKVSQVAGGDAAIIAELPCGVLVGSGTMSSQGEGSADQLTWAATIPYNSRLFNEIAKVSIGDFVNVSGTFVQIEAFKSGQNETQYASNSIGKNPLVAELGLDSDLYLLDLAYFMMLR